MKSPRRLGSPRPPASPSGGESAWIEWGILPAANLAVALLVSAAILLIIGENPARALRLLVAGAFGSGEYVGYTLYYATNFLFTGLSVAVAFHAGLFNIGSEGQAYIGGLCVGCVCLAARTWPFALVLPAAVAAAAIGGGPGPSSPPGSRRNAAATS